ncbi:MAG: hypothetical protein IPO35_08795 [Uliginosibacterium sp.]|nr:hypothetical protein [Uliginosibacterium sp.]
MQILFFENFDNLAMPYTFHGEVAHQHQARFFRSTVAGRSSKPPQVVPMVAAAKV